MTEVLSIRDLRVIIGRGARAAHVLRGVSLALQPGEVRGLVGESGAGKSMLGRAVLGLLPADARVVTGAIQFAGRDFLAMPERERRDAPERRCKSRVVDLVLAPGCRHRRAWRRQ